MLQAVCIIAYTENIKNILLLIKYSIFQDFPCILPSPFPIREKKKNWQQNENQDSLFIFRKHMV